MEEEFERIDSKNSWGAFYQFIRYKSRDPHLSHKEARKSSNIHLNRYKDVYPYDHSRICLHRANTDYINASLVLVPAAKRAYVLTQGPLSTTTGHFWAMVWEQKCKGIIMLNRTIEKNIIKCHQYWPSFQPNSENELHLNDVNLKVANLGEEISSNYIIRELLLTDLETGESRILYHFHYVTWPDFGVPESPEAFLQFLHIIREKGILHDENVPPVVHCSAGIGRSGTFCLVDSCLVMIEEMGSMDFVSVKDLLLEMRKYRMGLIQTPDQLRFSYLAIIEGAKDILIESKPPPLPQKQKLGEILEDKLCLEYASDEAESEETSEESVSSSCDKSEEEIVSMQEMPQEQEAQIDISKEDSETAIEFMQRNEIVPEENENILVETENISNIVKDSCKNDKTADILCEELTSQVVGNEICKQDEAEVNKSTLEEEKQSTSYFLSSETEQLSDDIQPSDKIHSINTPVENAKLSEKNETVLTDNGLSEAENNSFDEFPVINESKNTSEILSYETYCGTKATSFENQSENMDSLEKDSSLSINSAAINENEEINFDMCDRYLEFYQNGDVYSIKTKNEKEKLLKNENSKYLSELSFGSFSNFSSHCNNIKSSDIKIATRSGQRSSSCPRQLPSIVSKLSDKINGKLRKRRNSADSGISAETASPLKLRKTQEIISDDEYESIGKIEKFLEMTSKSSPSDFSEEKPKETFTRSRM